MVGMAAHGLCMVELRADCLPIARAEEWYPDRFIEAPRGSDRGGPKTRRSRGYRSFPQLERVAVGLAGPDPQRMIDGCHKDLAVADLSRAGAGGNHIDCLVGDIGSYRDLDPQLGQE